MSLGSRLVDLLYERRITQKQLATDLNVSPATLNGYVKDYREPDINTLCRLADYFHVSVDYLLDYHKSAKVEPHDLNEREKELLKVFHFLNDDQQDLLLEQGKLLLRMGHKKTY